MSNRTMDFGIRITADGKVAVAETGKVEAAQASMGKAAVTATTQAQQAAMSWTDFVKTRMGPAMKQFAAEGASHSEAHTKAIRQIGAEWQVYKATVQSASQNAANVSSGSLNTIGNSAKQTAFALRGVPAQFTDIVTALQAGQNPMQVFLQQGGQLKDMFGGVVPAAKALGGYVLGLVNPFTIAAAAVGGLGFAYYQGSKETTAYNKAIIMSGNVAGVTSSQLAAMAGNIDRTIGTQAKAAETLVLMAAGGKIAGDNLQKFSQVAIEVERSVGQSTEETVKALEALGQSPVAASLKLNDSLHYLTAETYKQIKAAEELGDKERAASIAQNAYADAMKDRAAKITQNQGYIEHGWTAVKDAAKDAWDAMLGIGRAGDPVEQATKRIAAIQAKLADASKPENVAYDPAGSRAEILRLQKELVAEQANLAAATASTVKDTTAAVEKGKQVALDAARIDLENYKDKFKTEAQKLADEVKLAKGKILAAAGLNSQSPEDQKRAALSTADARQLLGSVTLQHDQAALAAAYSARLDMAKRAGENEIAALAEAHEKGLISEVDYQKKITQIREAAITEQIRLLGEQYTKTADPKQRKQLLAQMQALTAEWVKTEEEGAGKVTAAQRKMAEESGKAIRDHIASLAQAASAAEAANETYGMTDAQIQRLEISRAEDARLIDEQAIATLRKNGASDEEIAVYQKQIDYLDQIIEARTRIANAADVRRQRDQQVDMWKSIEGAAHSAFNNIEKGGKNVAQSLRDSFKSGFYDWLWQMGAKPFFVNVVANVSGSGVAGAAFPNASGIPGVSGGSGGGLGSFSLSQTPFSDALYNLSASDFGNKIGVTDLMASSDMLNGAADFMDSYGGYIKAAYDLTQGNYGSAAGTAIGMYFGGPIGAAIGGSIGDAIFGGGNKEDPHNTAKESGVSLALTKAGVTAPGAAPMREARGDPDTGYNGIGPALAVAGPTSGNGWWGDFTAMTSAQIAAINKQITATFAAGASMATSLGIDPSVLDSVKADSSKDAVGSAFHLAGTFPTIEAAFSSLADAMARKLLPAFQYLALEGETATQTLNRVIAAMQARDQLDAAIGNSLGLLNGSLTEYDINLKTVNASIIALQDAAANSADVQKTVDLENQLFQAVSSRYNLEKQYLDQLRATVQSAMADLSKAQSGSAAAKEHILGASVMSAADLRSAIVGAASNLSSQLLLDQAKSGYIASTSSGGVLPDVANRLSAAQAAYDEMQNDGNYLPAVIDELNSAFAAWQEAAAQAQPVADATSALNDAVTAYSADVTKAADKLSTLRDETLKYYDAQAQLADLMHNSAAALGGTVTGLQRANMTGVNQSADILAEFRSLYDSASGLDGAALAGRADQLNSLASTAIQSAQAAWASGPEFQGILSEITGDLSALQTRLDAAAPKDYQAESLALLSGIDLSLSQLQDGLSSADSMVVDAVNSSKTATVDMLTQIRDKLDKLISVNTSAPVYN